VPDGPGPEDCGPDGVAGFDVVGRVVGAGLCRTVVGFWGGAMNVLCVGDGFGV
jgi:hypothetical protein